MFNKTNVELTIQRINSLHQDKQPLWGKMSVGQMLSHCCVSYEMVYEDKHPYSKGIKKWMLTKFVKPIVVSDKPYKRNSRTAPEFIITTQKDFTTEKKRLIDFILKTSELGSSHFENLESKSFGKLTSGEWDQLFSKHLDHHLSQFGV
jgi:hypothetical protein